MRTLFISGSGFNIFLQGGALKYVSSLGKNFDIHAGSSSGSYLSLAFHLGWELESLYEWSLTSDPNLRSELREYWINLVEGSLISDEGKSSFIRQMIEASPVYKAHFSGKKAEEITFSEISQVVSTKFLCNATRLTSGGGEVEIFSDWTTPDLSVHWAVMASMSFVGLFRPTLKEKERYVDGAFIVDYLPTCFHEGTGLYYKIRYPDVDIPIDLSNSWGILFQSTPTPFNEKGDWNLFSLISFLRVAIHLYKQNEIEGSPWNELHERTWTVKGKELYSFPNASTITQLYQDGFQQASEQGKRGL